jgi:hypothetical protein
MTTRNTIQVNGGTVGEVVVFDLDPTEDVELVDTSGAVGRVWSCESYPSDLSTAPSVPDPTNASTIFPAQNRPGTTYTIKLGAVPGQPDCWVALHFPNADGNAFPSPGFNRLGADPHFQDDSFGGRADQGTDKLANAYIRTAAERTVGLPPFLQPGSNRGAAINAALASADSASFAAGVFGISSNVTIGGAGKALVTQPGTVFKPAFAVVLTLDCSHDAPDDRPLFDLSDGGSVVFGANGPRRATPHHFGAVGDGSTDDQPAIQAANDAFQATRGILSLGPYDYATGSMVTISNEVDVHTHGVEHTRILPFFSGTAVAFTGGSFHRFTKCQPMAVVFDAGNGCANVVTSGANLLVGFDITGAKWGQFHQLFTQFIGCGGTGIFGDGSVPGSPYYNIFYQPQCGTDTRNSNTLPVHLTGGSGANANTFLGGSSSQCRTNWIEAGVQNTFRDHTTESYDRGSSYYTFGGGARDNHVVSGYFEAAADSDLTIATASSATPVVVTTTGSHGLTTGVAVTVAGVTGNAGSLGFWRVTVLSPTTFSLVGSVGTGSGTGGTVSTPVYQSRSDTPSRGNYHLVPGSFGSGSLPLTAIDNAGMDPTSVYGTNRLESAQGTGVKVVSTTGGTTTLTEVGRGVIIVAGVLVSNAVIEVPPYVGQTYTLQNYTTGAYTVTIKAIGDPGAGFAVGRTPNAPTDGVIASGIVNQSGALVRATPDVCSTGLTFGPTPTIVDVSGTLGSTGTYTIAGNDSAGVIALNPGGTSIGAYTIFDLVWSTTLPGTFPIVTLTLSDAGSNWGNGAAANLASAKCIAVSTTSARIQVANLDGAGLALHATNFVAGSDQYRIHYRVALV